MRRRVALLARGPRPPGPPPCANAPAAARPPKGSGPGPGGGKCPHSRPARSRAYRRSAKEVFGALLPLSGSPLGRRPAVAFSPLRVLPPCCAVLARLARCGRRAPAPLSRPASVVFSLALSRSAGRAAPFPPGFAALRAPCSVALAALCLGPCAARGPAGSPLGRPLRGFGPGASSPGGWRRKRRRFFLPPGSFFARVLRPLRFLRRGFPGGATDPRDASLDALEPSLPGSPPAPPRPAAPRWVAPGSARPPALGAAAPAALQLPRGGFVKPCAFPL